MVTRGVSSQLTWATVWHSISNVTTAAVVMVGDSHGGSDDGSGGNDHDVGDDDDGNVSGGNDNGHGGSDYGGGYISAGSGDGNDGDGSGDSGGDGDSLCPTISFIKSLIIKKKLYIISLNSLCLSPINTQFYI